MSDNHVCEECARREAEQRVAGRWLCQPCSEEVDEFMRDEQRRIARQEERRV